MRMAFEMRRDRLLELLFHLERRLAGRQPGAVTDAEDVRVDRNRVLAEGGVEYDVRRLAADAG